MAFTGDIEHLPVIDVIQLVHTTRKSGFFSVKGIKGESRIVFRNGFIVGANHIDNSVRIGTVLVKTGVITIDDLKQAMGVMKNADENRMPLLATLVQMGLLKREDALRGLKKLVVMTIVELMSWTKGTFTFDTDAVVASVDGEHDLGVDAQMVLMDALRIFDERERDRTAGKEVPSFEALYLDVVPEEGGGETKRASSVVTADDLGLADLDRLEKIIPRPASEMQLFDPVAIHRQNVQEILAGFSSGEQEAFVSFLRKSVARKSAPDSAAQQAGKAVVLFSGDNLIRHSVMTICNQEGIPVFSTDDEKDLERIVTQCLSAMRMPLVVFDSPLRSEDAFTEKKILSMRTAVIKKYSAVTVIQFASIDDPDFFLQSYSDGVRAVFPKPLKELRRETYILDTIQFLDTFKVFIRNYQERSGATDRSLKGLKEDIKLLREINNSSDAAMVILASVAERFERAVTFLVRASELVGERAAGVSSDKNAGPTPADRLKIPLLKPSVFRDVLEKGTAYYGESSDEAIKGLFQEIGKPVSPVIVLLPLMCDGKVVAVIYGDFGKKAASPVQLDMLEILALQAGIALDYAVLRGQAEKAGQKA